MPNPSPILFGTLTGSNGATGNCVIFNGTTWVLYTPTNAGSLTGCQIGILLAGVTMGSQGPIQVAGFIDPTIFNLGLGTASTIVPGLYPARGGTSTPLGTCDVNGAITIIQSYVGIGFGGQAAEAEPVVLVTTLGATGAGDDTVPLQRALDTNSASTDADVVLNATANTFSLAAVEGPLTMYQISRPLGMDDQYTSTPSGNVTKRFRGIGRNRVGIMPTLLTPGNVGTQSWIGPLVICGNMNWNGPVYVTDSTGSWGSATCLVSGGNGSPYLNYSQWDTGTLNGLSAMGLEFEWNILSDTPGPGFEYLLATSYGNLLNATSAASSALQIIRTDAFGAKQILAIFVTSNGQFFITLPLDMDFTPNTKQVLGFSYDGAHAYLALDGQQPLFSSVTATGTSPPAVTFTGTPTGAHLFNVVVEASGTTYKWNSDGGAYNTGNTIGAPATHALASGVSAVFPSGSYIAGQSWTVGTGVPTVAVTGTVSQLWYEELVIGIGGFSSWPQTTNVFFSGLNFHLGRGRLSQQALFTGPYTPNPSAWTCDSHTMILHDFAPANQGSGVRPSFADWVIARTGAESPSGSLRSNMPVWLWVHANTIPFHDNCEISDMVLCNPQGQALMMMSASNSYIHGLNIQGYKCIEWQNFCYPFRIDNTAILSSSGDDGAGMGQKIGLFCGDGAQGGYIGANMGYGGKLAYYIVSTFGDLWIAASVPQGGQQGVLYVSGSSSVVIAEGMDVDDESGTATYAHYAILSATKCYIRSGFSDSNSSTNPPCSVKVGLCQDLNFGSQPAYPAGVPIFSFGPAKNNGIPVQWDGQLDNLAGQTRTIIDPNHIGGVLVPAQEDFGVLALTQADADFTMTQPQQFWGKVAVGGTQTAKRKMLQAVHNPGKFTEWQNNTSGGFAITIIGPSGTGVDIADDGAWHRVLDDGTNIKAA